MEASCALWGGENRAGDCVADICPLPHARNHFVITTGFVATKVAVTNTKCYGVDLLCKSKTEGAYAYAKRCDVDLLANLKPKGRS